MQIEWNYNGITNLEEVEIDSNHGSVLGGEQTMSDHVMGNSGTTRPEALKTRDIHKRRVFYDGASFRIHGKFWAEKKTIKNSPQSCMSI